MSRGSALIVVALALSLSVAPAFALSSCATVLDPSCPHGCPMRHPSPGPTTLAEQPCHTSCCNLSSAKNVETAVPAPTASVVTPTAASRLLLGSDHGQSATIHRLIAHSKSRQQAVLCTFLV